jgi:hypothetical protein
VRFEELIREQRQNAEHYMHVHLGVAPDPQVPQSELVLEAAVAPLGCGSMIATWLS